MYFKTQTESVFTKVITFPSGDKSALQVKIDLISKYWPVQISEQIKDFDFYCQIEISKEDFDEVYNQAIERIKELNKC